MFIWSKLCNVAVIGHTSSANGDEPRARRMLRYSYGLSYAGIIIGVSAIVFFLALYLSSNLSSVPSSTEPRQSYPRTTSTIAPLASPSSPAPCQWGRYYVNGKVVCCSSSYSCPVGEFTDSHGSSRCCYVWVYDLARPLPWIWIDPQADDWVPPDFISNSIPPGMFLCIILKQGTHICVFDMECHYL